MLAQLAATTLWRGVRVSSARVLRAAASAASDAAAAQAAPFSEPSTDTREQQQQQQEQPSASASADDTTHFGYERVPRKEKVKLVGDVFHRVADRYDVMNDVMSGGVHRLWKDKFVRMLGPVPGVQIIDVAGGTGDIAFRMVEELRRYPAIDRKRAARSLVTVSDINPSMLRVGMQRAKVHGYEPPGANIELGWLEANAESIPVPASSYDAYTIAFGIRNCTNVDRVLAEAYRILRPGGRFMCLEFSHVHWPGVRQLYDAYSMNVIPLMGQLVTGDAPSYQYLVESIRQFPDQDAFAAMIRDAGFRSVTYENLTFGVVAIHSGFKL